jgi:hypothetical protein
MRTSDTNVTLEVDQCRPPIKRRLRNGSLRSSKKEALASVNHTVAEVDKREAAHFGEDKIRNKVKAAKKKYEDVLCEKFFGF